MTLLGMLECGDQEKVLHHINNRRGLFEVMRGLGLGFGFFLSYFICFVALRAQSEIMIFWSLD